MIQVEGIFAGKGGAALNVVAVPVLPDIVVENQITIITPITPGTIYFDTDEPANPVSGDVWVRVGNSDYGVEFSETFRNGLTMASQYNGQIWLILNGYVGLADEWVQFAAAHPPKGTALAGWTWKEIVSLANSTEDAEEYFAVGDTKDLVLSTGEVIPVVIGAFKHNIISGQNKPAQIAFTFRNCLSAKYQWNTTQTNVGGWDGSAIRNTHMVDILNTFPDELIVNGAIKHVDVVANAGGQTAELTTSSDRLRIHSFTELGLAHTNISIEGTLYDFYAAGGRVKTANGVATTYWVRSAYGGNNIGVAHVSTTGTATYINYPNSTMNVACAFDI